MSVDNDCWLTPVFVHSAPVAEETQVETGLGLLCSVFSPGLSEPAGSSQGACLMISASLDIITGSS